MKDHSPSLQNTEKCKNTAKKNRINYIDHQKINFAVYIIILTLFVPLPSYALIDVSLEWSPNPESDLAGYKLFARIEGEDYDYSEPAWQGTDTSCTIAVYDDDLPYFFIIRAFSEDGRESQNSNEVCYRCPDDAKFLNDPNSVYSSEGGGDNGCFIRAVFQ